MRQYAFSRQAEADLGEQITFLIDRNAGAAAERLADRAESFIASFLVAYPRSGKFIAARDLWETWIPGTKLVLWYRFTETELDIVRIWHASRDRDTDPMV